MKRRMATIRRVQRVKIVVENNSVEKVGKIIDFDHSFPRILPKTFKMRCMIVIGNDDRCGERVDE